MAANDPHRSRWVVVSQGGGAIPLLEGGDAPPVGQLQRKRLFGVRGFIAGSKRLRQQRKERIPLKRDSSVMTGIEGVAERPRAPDHHRDGART